MRRTERLMDCATARSKLFPYLDGELEPGMRDPVDAHLAGCEGCRRLVALEVTFREAYVERLRPDPAPERVREQVTALLRDLVEGRRPPAFQNTVRTLFAALAPVVVAGCGGPGDGQASGADVGQVVNGALIVTEESR